MTWSDLVLGSSIEIDGNEVPLRNLDKVVVAAGAGRPAWTKADTVRYYLAVGDAMVPYLTGRAATAVQYPRGVGGPPLYRKGVSGAVPDWVNLVEGPGGSDGTQPYVAVDDLATLVWAVNAGGFELHAPMSTAEPDSTPTHVVFDLDPGEGVGMVEVARAAIQILEHLEATGAAWPVLVKTSGSKGIHVLVDNAQHLDVDDTVAWSHSAAADLVGRFGDRLTNTTDRASRRGKVLVDWMQNHRHRTTATAWTLRGARGLQASVPITRDELEAAARGTDRLVRTPDDAIERLRAWPGRSDVAQ